MLSSPYIGPCCCTCRFGQLPPDESKQGGGWENHFVTITHNGPPEWQLNHRRTFRLEAGAAPVVH